MSRLLPFEARHRRRREVCLTLPSSTATLSGPGECSRDQTTDRIRLKTI